MVDVVEEASAARSLPPLVRLARTDRPLAREHAACVLRDLARDDAGCIAAHGGIAALVELLDPKTPAASKHAACALERLTLHDSANRIEMVRAGGIGPLVALAQSSTEAERAASLLRILASEDVDDVHAEIVAQGGVATLLALVERGGATREKAALALANMTVNHYARPRLVDEGGIAPLVALVESGTERSAQYAALALANIAVDHAAEIACEGGYAPLDALARSPSTPERTRVYAEAAVRGMECFKGLS